jgi:hypothetical protein
MLSVELILKGTFKKNVNCERLREHCNLLKCVTKTIEVTLNSKLTRIKLELRLQWTSLKSW